jgi:hypothetical protein
MFAIILCPDRRNKMRSKTLFLTIIACAILVSAGSVFSQDDRLIGGRGITVFKDRDFRGASASYQNDVANLAGTQFNDQISSIRIGPGEQWEVCRDADYRGDCVIVSGEERDLRRNSWDNKISSFRRIGGGGPTPTPSNDYIVLFDRTNFRGNPTNVDRATSDLGSMNRRAQSVTIGRGTWVLCDRINFGGKCVTLSSSSSNLAGQGMANRIASVRPVGDVPEPSRPNPYIVIFTDPNYRGTPTNYNSSRTNINKRSGSITVGAGLWEVCNQPNFGGRCETLTQSVPNVISLNIGRTIRSVRPVGPQPR